MARLLVVRHGVPMNESQLPDPNTEPTVTVERAAGVLGISRGSAYEAARRGDIPTLRLGRRLLVPSAALLRLVGFDPTAPSAESAAAS